MDEGGGGGGEGRGTAAGSRCVQESSDLGIRHEDSLLYGWAAPQQLVKETCNKHLVWFL